MGAVVALNTLLDARTVWRGRAAPAPDSRQPTGYPDLDARLPQGGWPEHALTEILHPADGVGELSLVLPTLVRLTQAQQRVLLIAPPYRVHAPGWAHAGIALPWLHVVAAAPREALWAAEQCLRSAASWRTRKVDAHGTPLAAVTSVQHSIRRRAHSSVNASASGIDTRAARLPSMTMEATLAGSWR